MLKLDTIRPYAEGDLDKIDLRDMDLKMIGDNYKEKIKINIKVSETLTVQKDGEILAIIGLRLIASGKADIWTITGNAIERSKILFAKSTVIIVDFWIKKYNLHRLQANAYSEHHRALDFLEWHGFEREGLMKKFGRLREDFYLYARTSP